jgi:hypothetical protein
MVDVPQGAKEWGGARRPLQNVSQIRSSRTDPATREVQTKHAEYCDTKCRHKKKEMKRIYIKINKKEVDAGRQIKKK